MNDQEIQACAARAWALARSLELCRGHRPRLKVRRSKVKQGISGRAYRRSHRIVLSVGTRSIRGDIVETVLHEVSHLTDGGYNHGPGFRRNFHWIFAAWFSLPPVQFPGRLLWQRDQRAAELARAMYGENG